MRMNEVKCIKQRWLSSIVEHKYINKSEVEIQGSEETED